MRTFKVGIGVLLYTVSALAYLQATPAHAQPAVPEPATDLKGQTVEEVVVTARKRSERLQKVPVSVTAFTAADLAHDPVRALPDIQKQTPNLSFRSGATDPFGGSIAIRGQYADNNDLVSQPSVGVYIDDVYQAISLLGPGGFADASEVEVLKGAQGTLYGRNSTGGAIKISTPIPNYDGIGGKVKFGYGNYCLNEEFGSINIPIIDGKIAMRASFEHYQNDGYGYIINQGQRVDDIDSKTGNIAFRFNPIDDLQLILRGDISYARSNNEADNILSLNPLASGGALLALNYGAGKGIANLTDAYNAFAKEVFPGGSYNAYSAFPDPEAALRNDGTSLNATYDINEDLSVKSVTAYRKVMRLSRDDLLGSTVASIIGNQGQPDYDEVTQEIQLNGKALDQKLKYTLGYFYYSLDGTYLVGDVSLPYITGNFRPDHDGAALVNVSNSLYGQGTYALTDAVNLTAGLRWTSESSDETINAYKGDPSQAYTSTGAGTYECKSSPALVIQTLTGPLLPGQSCSAKYGSSFRNTSYTAGLDWSPADNLLLYVKTSRGFKAGGVNSNGLYNAFQPEISTDYEGGLKSEWLDRKLRLNTAIFTTDYNQIQRPLVLVVNGNLATEVVNAASATITGAEFEAIVRPIRNFEVRGSAAYLLAQYDKFLVPNPNASLPAFDVTGHRFSNVPRWHTTLSGAYTYLLDFGTLRTSVDWTYSSALAFSTDGPYTAFNSAAIQDGFSLWDARIALNIEKYDLEIALWGKNITDKKYLQDAIDLSSLLGAISGNLASPRTFGFEITKYF